VTTARGARPVRVAIALGSNLGDRHAHLAWAVDALRGRIRDLRVSPFVSTAPVDVPDLQPDYLNAVAVGRTTLSSDALMRWLLELEVARGRVRTGPRSARTLDLDLILYGDEVRHDAALTLPHPRYRERAFVLEPLAALAPRWRDPERGMTLARLWRTRGLPGRGKAARARA
jgi:2-amino-4-hydroxy-6-hydroxymethyldihydropteridine diphosphokinase